MLAVIQRANRGSVRVNNKTVAQIQKGLVIFLGIVKGDSPADANYLARKILELRIFGDQNNKMNLCAKEINAQCLVVSQFTLCADLNESGRRPSFDQAESPQQARELYLEFINLLKQAKLEVAQGVFREHMTVDTENDGPVTFILDSRKGRGG